MAKYVFHKCTSCQIGGKLYKKSDKVVFDTEDPKFKNLVAEIEAAAKAGYLEDTSKGNKAAIKAEAEEQKKEAKKETKKEADK